MDLQNLLRLKNQNNQVKLKNQQFQIQHNTQSILYKDHKNQNQQRINKKYEILSKQKMSPDNNKELKMKKKFQIYRCSSNILYQFQNYIVYNYLLGEGSFSKVYLGQIKNVKKLVAIKQVSKLQQNQIACLMNSQSPHIIKLYGFWNLNKHNYIALELCDGNLRQILSKITIEQKILYFQQIVQGMNELNKKKIIHRDLKFENILVKDGIIKISDFGFAKPIGSKLAVFSERCGTPYTMAPQIYFHNGQGKPVYSHKCDIYSLGVILHQMIYEKHPFEYCVQKMRKNQRISVVKKFGYLDILIDRSLQQEVAKRCNWNEFMQIYTLYKLRLSRQNTQVLREINRNQIGNNKKCVQQIKLVGNHRQKQKQRKHQNQNINILLKYKRNSNIYETPIKKEQQPKPVDPEKLKNNLNHEREKEKENVFYNVQLPQIKQKSQYNQKHRKFQLQKKQRAYLNQEIQRLLKKHQRERTHHQKCQAQRRKQEWKTEHDLYFKSQPQHDIQKHSNSSQQAISAVKLIALVLMLLMVLLLVKKQFED